jgi:uncharacterized protein (TIGR00299 family) protein
MKVAYFDCFSGAAGDMILAACIDAGWPVEALDAVVERLGLAGVSVCARRVTQHGLSATQVLVQVEPGGAKGHRHLPQIEAIIERAGFEPRVAEPARRVFRRLAEAEAQVHGTSIERVHFHEVGAADAIVDIVGACAALAQLGVEAVTCSPVPTGYGTVTCEHGVMPVPAPATARLLCGIPLAACEEPGELTTPTGAAILTTLAGGFGPPPAMTLTAVGVGAGTREGRTRPNILRVLLGETCDAAGTEIDLVEVLEAQLDDADGQALAYAAQRLLEAGALDVYLAPILMKKGRPGQLLTVLASPPEAARLEELILRETTTFGVRRHLCRRSRLGRERVAVPTRFGPIRVKVGLRGGERLRVWPEYEDCAAAAQRAGVDLREVQQAALRAWSERNADG